MPEKLMDAPAKHIDTAKQTPIEIALGIDDQGRTTARKLYEFLELHPAHYSRWCKKNIENNQFAEENVDFWAFTLNGEWGKGRSPHVANEKYQPNFAENGVFTSKGENSKGGRPTQDYKLTAGFAKKLAMIAGGEKGEAAREYFLKTEDALKLVATQRKTELDQIKVQLFDLTATNTALAKRFDDMERRQAAIEQRSLAFDLSDSERTAMSQCFLMMGKVLANKTVPPKKPAPMDLPLNSNQMETVRAAIRKCVEENMALLDTKHFSSSMMVRTRQIIRNDVCKAIKNHIGVSHTQAKESHLKAILWVCNFHKISDGVKQRINMMYEYPHSARN